MDSRILNTQRGPTVDIDIGRTSNRRTDTAMYTGDTAMTVSRHLCFVA